MQNVAMILWKEWLELRQQRKMLLGLAALPLLGTLLPVMIAYGVAHSPGNPRPIPPGMQNPTLTGLSIEEFAQAVLGQQFSILLLLMPLIIPSVLASYSVVGEKTSRTLEPLLATPIRTWELLLGKIAAAMLPAVGIAWACGALFVAGMGAVAVSGRVLPAIVTPGWLVVFLLCTPLLAVIAVAGTVILSARVNDPRTAQQLSGVIVIPIMAAFFGQLSGILVLSPALGLAAALALGAIAALALWAATRLFQREVILTRWT